LECRCGFSGCGGVGFGHVSSRNEVRRLDRLTETLETPARGVL
jgi:hypothetical protein